MSIFGLGSPKWTGTGDPDSNTVTLDCAVLDAQYSQSVIKMFESVINGNRNYSAKGVYGEFDVLIHLYQYDDDGSLPSSATKANTLLTYLHKDVLFYPYKDGVTLGDGLGKPIKNSSSTNVNSRIMEITFGELEKGGGLDLCNIKLKTNGYWDVSKIIQ